MPLIVFDGHAFPRASRPTFSVGKRGTLNLNTIAATYLSVPCRVDVILDTDKKQLIIRKNSEGKIKVESANRGRSGRVSNKALLKWLKENGVNVEAGKRYPGEIRKEENSISFDVGA